ncbi:MAG: DUF4367 domain-containing protein [Paraclostridium sp.]
MDKFNITDEDLVRCVTKFDDLRIDSLYKDEEKLNYTFTKEFENKMDDLIYRDKKEFSLNRAKKVVVGLSIMILCIFSLSLSVEAVRDKILKIIEEIKTEFTMFMFYKDKDNINSGLVEPENSEQDLPKLPVPQYIPSGFNEVNRLESPLDTIIIYQNNEGLQIRYSISPIENNIITLDTEDAIVEELYIGEYSAKYIEKNDMKQVFWNDDDYIYLIDCNLIDKEELINIAKNVKK